jgi:hypothetical protein
MGVICGDGLRAKLKIIRERTAKARIEITMSLARNSDRMSFHTRAATVGQNLVTALPR